MPCAQPHKLASRLRSLAEPALRTVGSTHLLAEALRQAVLLNLGGHHTVAADSIFLQPSRVVGRRNAWQMG